MATIADQLTDRWRSGNMADRLAQRWRAVLGSMRLRIVAAVVILMGASSLVSDVVLRQVLANRLADEIEISLTHEVEEFQSILGGSDPDTGQPFGSNIEAIFATYFRREVPDQGETLLAFTENGLYRDEPAHADLEDHRIQGAIQYWRTLDQEEIGEIDTPAGLTKYIAVPFTLGDRRGLFVVANFPAFEQGGIDEALATQGLTQFVTIVFASLIGLALAGRVLRPLRLLADTAQTITATDLTRRIPVRGRDEASRIANAFNEMLERLEAVVATQRQFLDDASHELRVPLTVVRGNVEVLELETDPEERATMITTVTNEIDRMNRIVEDLLLLARAERPDFLTLETVQLGDLMTDIHRKASVLCRRDWRLDESVPAVIRADGQRLTQAVMQLAQNACQHTADEAVIRMGSRIEDGHIVLWVHDSGPGVATEDAERVFDRYARGSGRPAGTGLGLGLSIVAAIALAHGGRVRLAQEARPGARFEIILPPGGAPAPVAEKS